MTAVVVVVATAAAVITAVRLILMLRGRRRLGLGGLSSLIHDFCIIIILVIVFSLPLNTG